MDESQEVVRIYGASKHVLSFFLRRESFAMLASMRLLYQLFYGPSQVFWFEMRALACIFAFFHVAAYLTWKAAKAFLITQAPRSATAPRRSPPPRTTTT